MISRRTVLKSGALGLATIGFPALILAQDAQADPSVSDFVHPPTMHAMGLLVLHGRQPQREGMTADLEALKARVLAAQSTSKWASASNAAPSNL